MMVKYRNPIILKEEGGAHPMQQEEIESYLSEAKDCVCQGKRHIEMNANRQDNIDLFTNYIIDEAKADEIILSLTARDFSEIRQNDHAGYEHEQIYIFGKDVILLERYGTEEKVVPLYIKFNKLENQYLIVISFHEQKSPLTYYFK